MNEVIQLAEMSLETLTALAKESFEDCAEPLQIYLANEQKLNRFGEILRACRAKVPHGKWQDWVRETFSGHLSLRAVQLWIAETEEPEKRQKRLEQDRTQKQKAKASKAQDLALLPEEPKPVTVGTIRHESPPTPQPQPERPAWLADPDELDRQEETDLPQLPRTNTHYTAENRRQPDARETDRQGLVTIDDPRDYVDGAWYEFDEASGRLFAVTHDQILHRAAQVMAIRSREASKNAGSHSGAPTPNPRDTKKVVESGRDTTPVVDAKPGKVPTVTQLRNVVEQRADIGTNRHLWSEAMVKGVQEWASYKQSLTGKAKVRSLEQWSVALTRIENVVAAQGWPAVADMIEKAIANGWQGWEHQTDNGRKPASVAPHRTYTRLNKPEIKYDELPE